MIDEGAVYSYMAASLLDALGQVGEEGEGIAVRQLSQVGGVDTCVEGSEPVAGNLKRLVGVVDGEEDAVDADFAHAESVLWPGQTAVPAPLRRIATHWSVLVLK